MSSPIIQGKRCITYSSPPFQREGGWILMIFFARATRGLRRDGEGAARPQITLLVSPALQIPSFPHSALAPSFGSLLQYASLRGSHALHAAPLPSFPCACAVIYNAGPFQGQGTVWNLSCTGWRLSGDLPMRPGETLSLTVTLPNEQRIEVPEE